MRRLLRWFSIWTAVCLLAGLLLPVFAAEEEAQSPAPVVVPEPTEEEKPPAPEPIRLDPFDPGPEIPEAKEGDIERLEDGLHYEIPEDWTAQDVIDWFICHYELDADCFSVCFYCPATGERAAWNEDAYFLAASTFKLPLNMYYYEQEAAGVYSPNTIVGGMPLSLAHQQSLLWSLNEVSVEMIYYLGPFFVYKQLVTERYGTLPEEDYPMAYWGNNYYSTHFMVDTLTYLYERLDEFPELVDYLKEAMPGYFLRKYNGDVPVLHKYGSLDLNVHDVGILFTEEPCLTAIYTHEYQKTVFGAELISRLGKALIDYQTQRTELNRLAAEQTEPEETETEPATEESAAVTTEAPTEAGIETTAAPANQTEASAAESLNPTEAVPETAETAEPAAKEKSFPVVPVLLILLGAAVTASGLVFLFRSKK